MSRPPKIGIPGLNRGAGIPAGYILGRLPGTGRGPAQLLNLTGMRGMGVATTAGVVASTSSAISIAHSETTSLSGVVSVIDGSQSTSLSRISSSLSGAISSTTSLSSAVSTVDSGQTASLSQVSSSLSTTNSTNVTQSTSLSQISSSLSGAISSTSSLSSAVSTVDSNQSTSISANLSKINSLSTAVGGGGGTWGGITGTLSNQTDLQAALDARLIVLDDGSNWAPGAVRVDDSIIAFTQGDNSVNASITFFGGNALDITAAGWELDLKSNVGGTWFGNISAANRHRFRRYGTITGLEFDADPYVNTNVIFHAGNLSFGTGLTYTGGVLTATGSGFETLDVDYTDGGNTTTSQTDLFTYTITAGKLTANGDRVETQWSGVFVSSGTATRQLRAYFGGTMIFDSGALTISLAAAWDVFCTITRVSATVVRYAISMTTEGAALAAYTASGEVTGLTLSNTNIVKLTGTAAGVGAATNDIVGKMGNVSYYPVSGGALNTNQSTSLSQISSSLSGAISSTSSLSTAVSTVISGSISSANSRIDSLSTAVGGGSTPWDFVPPLAADFANFVSGDATNVTLTDDANEGMLVDSGTLAGGGDKFRLATKIISSSGNIDWNITAKFKTTPPGNTNAGFGLIAHENATNKLAAILFNSGNTIYAMRGTTILWPTTVAQFTKHLTGGYWFRLRHVASSNTLFYEYSNNGKQWQTLGSVGDTTAFTTRADRAGVVMQMNVVGGNDYASVSYWSQSL